MKTLKTKLWNNYIFTLTDKITLNHEVITEAVTDFFINSVNQVSDNEHVQVLFKIRSVNGSISTIGILQHINKNDLNFLIDYIEGILHIKSDEYKENIISNIIFSFTIRKGEIPDIQIDHRDRKPKYQNYRHYKIPSTMDINKYGVLIHQDIENNTYVVQVTPLTIARVKQLENGNDVDILKNGIKLLTYKDRWVDEAHFKRQIGSNTYQFTKEGNIELLTISKPSRIINKTKVSNRS